MAAAAVGDSAVADGRAAETGEEVEDEASTPTSAEARRYRCLNRCPHHYTPKIYPDMYLDPCRCESQVTRQVLHTVSFIAYAPIEYHAFVALAVEGLPVDSLGFKTIYRNTP